MQSFNYSLYNKYFMPEVSLVRSVSNLKLCMYQNVEEDFKQFKKMNDTWAAKIDDALSASEPPLPIEADMFTKLASQAVSSEQSELERLQVLGKRSIEAALPAIGIQKHWADYEANIKNHLEISKKSFSDEKRRQWKNARVQLGEAIKKMRFVKLEYMNQVRQMAQSDTSNIKSMIASNDNKMVPAPEKDQLVFPLGNDFWPDELFKMRSTAQSQCLKKVGTL
jgi:hypothetical protein